MFGWNPVGEKCVGKQTITGTSYFCLVIWSCSSNFSASSWYIHSHSSLAFSLQNAQIQQCSSPSFLTRWVILSINSAVCLSPSTYLRPSGFRLSMSSNLRLSLRIFFFFSLSVCLLPLRFSVYRQAGGLRACVLRPPPTAVVYSPASACTPRNEGSWGFSFSWHHPLPSSWLPPLPYEFSLPK